MKEKKDKRTNLQKEQDAILEYMSTLDPRSNDYARCVTQLGKLFAMEPNKSEGIKPDTWLNAGVSILQIGMILGHEKMHVITSKAMNFVKRGKL